jgi:hypothetical protein
MIVYLSENIDRAYRTGVDSEARLSFLDYGYVTAGYSYVFAWDRKTGERLRPQPEHTLKFKLGVDTAQDAGGAPGADADKKKVTVAAWAGGRWFSPLHPGEPGNDSRLILDAYFGVGLPPHWRVYFTFDNMLGTIDQFLGPATPQTISAGVQYTL